MTGQDQADAVRLDNLTKVYGAGSAAVHALRGVTLAMRWGTFTALMGPSGSGKSTLLHCAAGLDTLTSDRVLLDHEFGIREPHRGARS